MAGFSFDSYTEIDRAQGVWVSTGDNSRVGIEGVKVVLLSPRFVRDAFSGILRVRILSGEGLRNVAMAGAVAVFLRTTSGSSSGGLRGFQRNRVRRGVLNGLAQWLDEDDSVYLYVPKGAFAGSEGDEVEESTEDPCLFLEVHRRSLLDNSSLSVAGRASIPMSDWSPSKRLKELCVELKPDEKEEGEVDVQEDGEERPPSRLRLQLEYDAFELPEDPAASTGADEQLDDVTPEARARRQRFGSNVPAEIRLPDLQRMSEHELQAALRCRGLTWLGEGREALEKRLQTSIAAEKAVYDSGSWWSTVESFLGTDRKAQLEDAMGVAATAAETLSGDFFAAMGAGIMSGAGEIAGFDELMKGDFAGAMKKRKDVWEVASSEEGRAALRQKADVAMKRAKQQAMIRLAQGMELMSVRKGAWKMLEQAVMDEGAADGTSFADYEQLAYLEAGSTNTECWVWRLLAAKRIVVAFRGTCDFGDVLTDIAAIPRVIGDLGKVHEGFSRAYDSVREALHAVLERGCLGDGEGWEVVFTGHSLGGALATLASLDIARTIRGLPADFGSPHEVGKIRPTPLRGAEIIACTFGAPRVGSARVAAAYDEFVPRAWRIFSTSDVVPAVPPTSLWGFRHAGIGVELDPQKSELIVRGRTAGLKEAALEEAQAAKEEQVEEGGSSLMLSFQGDIWSSFDEVELAELRRVIGTGTSAVGEHMEDNYFARIQECLSETSQSRRSDPPAENASQAQSGELPGEWAWQSQPPTPAETVANQEAAPAWSSLSLEDRKRFGLDGQDLPPSQRLEAAELNPHLPTAVSRHAVSHHPDVLWGNAGMPGPPTMAKTLAQLEAVGMASNLSRLEETERKLQRLKLG
ncbi:unnamed protein product [Symbiodinium natans]|uniref:Fungal lipase-type domain-containing protein n=1 Tax=Symbiodinium natans TaxID=878477 RepID=A0A812R2V8_9DINO|nr:unnamed protein product [Symbiodinium natans]